MIRLADRGTLRVPLTIPKNVRRRRFTESEGQAEYVACMEAGLSFAASGTEGQWLYYDGETILAVYPDSVQVSRPFKGLHWITEAQKL